MPVKVYKGGILQIVSSPDSSSSFWKSCTTFGGETIWLSSDLKNLIQQLFTPLPQIIRFICQQVPAPLL